MTISFGSASFGMTSLSVFDIALMVTSPIIRGMKSASLFLMACLGMLSLAKGVDTPSFPEPVNSALPMVGTDVTGHTYPGATVPFGMVQLSPDTHLTGWQACAGYAYSDKTILGFSHTHLSGTGVADLGDILLMPTVGDSAFDPVKSHPGYFSAFAHEDEFARPGYYKVFLQDPKVTVELTATAHTGFHRYTYPESSNSHVVIDLISGLNGDRNPQNEITVESSDTISGHRMTNGWAHNRDVYFVAQFSKPFTGYGIETNRVLLPDGSKTAKGKIRAFVSFPTTANEQILVKVGISGTSVEAARKNLSQEIPDWNFDQVQVAAMNQWKDALSKIEIETTDRNLRETFYSNLYLSMVAPTLYNDVDGGYRGMDHSNHPDANFQNYTTFSIWDVYRAEMPLLLLLQPERQKDFIESLLTEYKEFNQHQLPVWPLWGTETECMIGFHSAPIIANAYLKGFRDFDAQAALAALEDTAENPRDFQDEFNQNGYVSTVDKDDRRDHRQSVSRTLEYAYDNWCVGQLAQAMGKTDEAAKYLQRAQNYQNVFNASTGFMQGKTKDGKWRDPFVPNQLYWEDYTEADAWQYTFSVQQDIPGLIKLMGGDQPFMDKLDQLFTADSKVINSTGDISGLIGQYDHGDEPVHHDAYLYDYAGAPYKTQEYVRKIMSDFYSNRPDGQCGNTDCGQMSAWYVFSALGLYPVNPVSGVYLIGSPTIDKATIHLDPKHFKGPAFTVEALDNSPKNIYIQSAKLNGAPLDHCWITHAELTHGGTLQLQMGDRPNLKWGADAANRPPVFVEDK